MIAKFANKNYQIDLPNRQITFLDSRFYLTESGNYVPSVTHILDCYPKGAQYFEWLKKAGEDADTIRDEAGNRGSIVHKLTERYDMGEEVNLMNENGDIDFKLSEWAMFERYVEFRRRFKLEIDAIELNLISEELGYAGTLDRLICLNNMRLLVDIKTSNSIYPSYWLQLAAYRSLLVENNQVVDAVAILWLNAKTKTEGKAGTIQGPGYQMIIQKDSDHDLRLFEATHELWKAENEGLKPKQLSYKLSHQIS